MLGPQFPHLESRGDHTSFSGRWSQERREHAFRDHTVPGSPPSCLSDARVQRRDGGLSKLGDPNNLLQPEANGTLPPETVIFLC